MLLELVTIPPVKTSSIIMKTHFFVALALLAVFSSVLCDTSEEIVEKIKSKHVKKLINDKKDEIDGALESLEEKCPGVTNKLKGAVKSFLECDDKVDDSLTICQQIQTAALNCTTPLLKVVDDCLPTKAKGLPTLGLKSLISLADFLCKQNGEAIFELANPCLWEDHDDEESNANRDQDCDAKVDSGFSKISEVVEEKDPEKIPTTTEICTALTGYRSCAQKNAAVACKSEKTKEVVRGVYDALIAPCTHINET